MKVYISGKISGLPFEEVKAKFKAAEEYLRYLGHTTVNPAENGLDFNAPWKTHMLHDISLLMPCDAIYLLEDWIDSRGAMLEKLVAELAGIKILFQFEKKYNDFAALKVFRIQGAIEEVTGLKFEDYKTNSRKRNCFFARMIFAYYCCEVELTPKEIAKYIHRDYTTIHHYLRKYNDECKYNPSFRIIAEQIKEKLENSMYHIDT